MGITRIIANRKSGLEDAYQVKVRHLSKYFSVLKYGEQTAYQMALEAREELLKKLSSSPGKVRAAEPVPNLSIAIQGRIPVLTAYWQDSTGTRYQYTKSLRKYPLKEVLEEYLQILKDNGYKHENKQAIKRKVLNSLIHRYYLERSRGVELSPIRYGYGTIGSDLCSLHYLDLYVHDRKKRGYKSETTKSDVRVSAFVPTLSNFPLA